MALRFTLRHILPSLLLYLALTCPRFSYQRE
jgi:hypothetical protein